MRGQKYTPEEVEQLVGKLFHQLMENDNTSRTQAYRDQVELQRQERAQRDLDEHQRRAEGKWPHKSDSELDNTIGTLAFMAALSGVVGAILMLWFFSVGAGAVLIAWWNLFSIYKINRELARRARWDAQTAFMRSQGIE